MNFPLDKWHILLYYTKAVSEAAWSEQCAWRSRVAGRARTIGNRVYLKRVSRVQIPPSPPIKSSGNNDFNVVSRTFFNFVRFAEIDLIVRVFFPNRLPGIVYTCDNLLLTFWKFFTNRPVRAGNAPKLSKSALWQHFHHSWRCKSSLNQIQAFCKMGVHFPHRSK